LWLRRPRPIASRRAVTAAFTSLHCISASGFLVNPSQSQDLVASVRSLWNLYRISHRHSSRFVLSMSSRRDTRAGRIESISTSKGDACNEL
jgi:hypothetical protein